MGKKTTFGKVETHKARDDRPDLIVVARLGREEVLVVGIKIHGIVVRIPFRPVRQEIAVILQRRAALEALEANRTPTKQKQ